MKDLYKILQVSTTASQNEIKDSYRKLAMALHPDRHDGCEIKSSEFKNATEAYQTLSDKGRRSIYDARHHHNHHNHHHNGTRHRSQNHRKVYAPHPPPGFKTFDSKRHYDMHYGDGMLKEAMERILRRQRGEQGLSGDVEDDEYVSPLGRGFRFNGKAAGSHARQKGAEEYEYEEAYVQTSPCRATRVMRTRELVTIRMQERRKERVQSQRRGMSFTKEKTRTSESEEGACVVM